jgi:hypothetical protein
MRHRGDRALAVVEHSHPVDSSSATLSLVPQARSVARSTLSTSYPEVVVVVGGVVVVVLGEVVDEAVVGASL